MQTSLSSNRDSNPEYGGSYPKYSVHMASTAAGFNNLRSYFLFFLKKEKEKKQPHEEFAATAVGPPATISRQPPCQIFVVGPTVDIENRRWAAVILLMGKNDDFVKYENELWLPLIK